MLYSSAQTLSSIVQFRMLRMIFTSQQSTILRLHVDIPQTNFVLHIPLRTLHVIYAHMYIHSYNLLWFKYVYLLHSLFQKFSCQSVMHWVTDGQNPCPALLSGCKIREKCFCSLGLIWIHEQDGDIWTTLPQNEWKVNTWITNIPGSKTKGIILKPHFH